MVAEAQIPADLPIAEWVIFGLLVGTGFFIANPDRFMRVSGDVMMRTGVKVKKGFIWCRERPLIAFAIGGPSIITLFGVAFWCFGAFRQGQATDWGQIREYVQSAGYLFAATGIGLGLHYAGRRSEAMNAANEVQRLGKRNDNFAIALGNLASEHGYLRVAAIKSLERLGKETDQEFYAEVVAVLSAFLVNNSHVSREETITKEQQREINEGFLSLCAVENAHKDKSLFKKEQINLEGLKLNRFFSTTGLSVPNMNLNRADLSNCAFLGSTFHNMNFDDTKMMNVSLKNTAFRHCYWVWLEDGSDPEISNTDFAGVIWVEGLRNVKYEVDTPPINLPAGTELPPPWNGNRFMSTAEAEAYWAEDGHDECRPRDRKGNPIEIIDPVKDEEDAAGND